MEVELDRYLNIGIVHWVKYFQQMVY